MFRQLTAATLALGLAAGTVQAAPIPFTADFVDPNSNSSPTVQNWSPYALILPTGSTVEIGVGEPVDDFTVRSTYSLMDDNVGGLWRDINKDRFGTPQFAASNFNGSPQARLGARRGGNGAATAAMLFEAPTAGPYDLSGDLRFSYATANSGSATLVVGTFTGPSNTWTELFTTSDVGAQGALLDLSAQAALQGVELEVGDEIAVVLVPGAANTSFVELRRDRFDSSLDGLTATLVPEPGSMMLLATGGALLAFRRRRKDG